MAPVPGHPHPGDSPPLRRQSAVKGAREWLERKDPGDDSMLDPDAIAETYLQFHRQDRSSWAWEIELRPWVETF